MTEEKANKLIQRILTVNLSDEAKFGQMNVQQMISHCSDQFRMMFGEVPGLIRQEVDLNELRHKAAKGETVETVKGLDQVAGEGTKPGNFEDDKKTLITYYNRFNETDDKFTFSCHPYYGEIEKKYGID